MNFIGERRFFVKGKSLESGQCRQFFSYQTGFFGPYAFFAKMARFLTGEFLMGGSG
jgi:hypothetical protein